MKTVIRPETEMKDSGIECIESIPKGWITERIKNLFSERNEKVDDAEPNELLSVSEYYGVAPRSEKINSDTVLVRAESLQGYKRCEKNDLVSNIMLAWKGAMGISQYRGVVSPSYCVYTPKKGICSQYYHYLFRTDAYKGLFKKYSTGIIESRLRLYTEQFFERRAIVPPLSEQQSIADYLDETCSKIDEIIAEAKASIDEYKELKQSVIDKAVLHGLCNGMMKDSGNDLIGKIPLSWEMRKLKYVADFNPGITTAYDAQKEVGYVPMNCVKNGYMNPLSARLSDMSTGLTGFQDGDIVIAKVTPCFENGNIAVAENLEQGVAFGSSELFVIRTHSINRRFMLYYLQNSVFKNQCISTMTGTGGLKRVSGYFVNNAYITYPPENEQQVIVNYLDEAVKNMDSLISEKESLINDLEAYKKSLIYEVVTGKRRVV